MKNANLKIVIISPISPPIGGIAIWTEKYLAWCNSRNYNVRLINTSLIGKRSKNIMSNLVISDEIYRTFRIFSNLRKSITSEKPDLIHLNTSCGRFGIIRDYLLSLFILKHRIKLIINYRCNVADQMNNRLLSFYFLRKLSNLADMNIVLNKASKQFLNDINSSKVIIIPNFVDLKSHFETRINKSKIDNVVFVGHIQKTKGVNEIFEAANAFPDINFELIGPVSKEIDCDKIKNNIKLVGLLNNGEIFSKLQKSDLFLFPTHTEGFSNALLEAMSVGLPIITTPVGANAEMIQNRGGYLVQVGSIKEIEDAIEIMKSKKVRDKMSEWNMRTVQEKYTIDIVLTKLFDIYMSIVND